MTKFLLINFREFLLGDAADFFSCHGDISTVFRNRGTHRHQLIIHITHYFEIFVAVSVLNID